MTSTGGMPSSHSAAVTSLTTAIAYEAGLDSPTFCRFRHFCRYRHV